jgi:Uma2 family endonuclease
LIEVRSPNDRSLEKLDFYASIGVREVLVVDQDDKSLRLFRLAGKAMVEVQSSDEGLRSDVVGLIFKTTPKRRVFVSVAAEPTLSWTV